MTRRSLPDLVRRAVLVVAALNVVLALTGAPLFGARHAGASPAVPPGCSGGVVTAAVSAGSLPGGRWSVTDGCIPHDAFYQVELAGHRLVLGLAEVTYDDGHTGRLALATIAIPAGTSISLVGVEDLATGFVRWAYAEGTADDAPGRTSAAGAGVTDLPDEPATLELEVRGTAPDLLTAPGPVAEQVRTVLFDAVEALTGEG